MVFSFFVIVRDEQFLTIYMIYRFGVNFRYTSRLLFEGLYKTLDETGTQLWKVYGALAWFGWFLYFYIEKISLKV